MTQPGTSGVSGVYRRVRKGAPLVLFGVVAALPHVYSRAYFIRLLFVTLVWLTTSVAWNILGGFAGQVSFGFAVFYGLGAYTTALLLNSGMNRVSCLLLGACVAAIASLLIGLPTFRLKGPYFAKQSPRRTRPAAGSSRGSSPSSARAPWCMRPARRTPRIRTKPVPQIPPECSMPRWWSARPA